MTEIGLSVIGNLAEIIQNVVAGHDHEEILLALKDATRELEDTLRELPEELAKNDKAADEALKDK